MTMAMGDFGISRRTLRLALAATICLAGLGGAVETESAAAFTPKAPRMLKPGSMETEGAMTVRADGTAAYTVPIEEPPGTAGMAPSIALTYSSGGGDGVLGIGWTLTGLPSITRCAETQAQDGQTIGVTFTATDRFCFAGQRLVAVSGTYGASGTTYRTEIDSFSLITSFGGSTSAGPQYFTVQTKSGETQEFGNSSTSFIQAIGSSSIGSGTARAWALDKVSDHAGNFYTVTYSPESTTTGETHPIEIDYTGNTTTGQSPYNAVKFFYNETRVHPLVTHLAGTTATTSSMLTEIQTILTNSTSPQLVHDYLLSYGVGSTGRPQLQSIQHCDGGSPQGCLPAMTFNFTTTTPFSSSSTTTPSCTTGTPAGGPAMPGWAAYVADLNNDGRDDLFWVQETAPMPGGAPGVTVPPTPTGEYQIWYSLGNGGFNCVTPSFSATSGGIQGFPSFGDFGGTGRTDILLTGAGSNNNELTLLTNTNDAGTFSSATSIPFTTIDFISGMINIADFEGKGRSSIVLLNNLVNGSSGNDWEVLTNSGDGHDDFTITPGSANGLSSFGGSNSSNYIASVSDFNGDGKADLLFVPVPGAPTSLQPMLALSSGDFSTGTGKFTLQSLTLPSGVSLTNAAITVADVNGDGIADLIVNPTMSPNGIPFTTGNLTILLGRGDGSFDPPIALSTGLLSSQVLAGNFSGSGYTDLLVMGQAATNSTTSSFTQMVYLSNGDGTFSAAQNVPCLQISGECAVTTPLIGDFVGVGQNSLLQDFGPFLANPSNPPITNPAERFALQLANSTQPDLLTSMVDGLGRNTTISYAPISEGAPLYVKDAVGAVSYPIVSLQTPMAVVSEVQTSDGIGGMRSMIYGYGALRADLSGRGFLGFGGYNTADIQTGIGVEMGYDQSFPFTGLPGTIVTSVPQNGSTVTLSTQTITYQDDAEVSATASPNNPGTPGVMFIGTQGTSTTRADLNGASLPTITTSMTYDCGSTPSSCFGNMLGQTVSPGSGYQTATTFTYAVPDTTHWLVNEIATMSVTDTVPNEPSVTRSANFTYQSGTGLLASSVIEPGLSFSNAASATEQLQLTTDYGYDSFGNRTTTELLPSESGAASRTTTLSWATPSTNLNTGAQFNQFPQTVTDALGHVAQMGYDTRFGAVSTMQNINNLKSNTSYDTFGRPTLSLRPDGTGTQFTYAYCSTVQSGGASCPGGSLAAYQMIMTPVDNAGHVIGAIVTATADILGRVIVRDTVGFDGQSLSQVQTTYNTLGQVTQATQPFFANNPPSTLPSTSFQYDALGRVTQQTAPDGGVTTHSYSGLSQSDTLPTGTGSFAGTETFSRTLTPLGQVATATDPIGNPTTYTYFAFGSLASVADAAGNTVSYSYDPLGRQTSLTDPDSGTRSATYLSTGELATATEPGGSSGAAVVTDTYAYDALGRLTSRSEPDLSSSWTYDPSGALGRLASASTASGGAAGYQGGMSYTYSYDSLTRPAGTTLQFGALAPIKFTNAYVPVGQGQAGSGQLASTTDNTSGAVEQYVYTPQGYLMGLSRSGSGLSSAVPVFTILATDASLRPMSVSLGSTGFTNNIASGSSFNITDSFAYDQLSELRTASNAATSKSYAYNTKTGNLTSKSDTGTYTYGSAGGSGPHQLQSIAGTGSEPLTASYSYDPRGNMLSGDGGASYTWTSFNQPATITEGGNTIKYFYDVYHNRIAVSAGPTGGTASTKLYLREAGGSFAEAMLGSSGTVSTMLNYFAVGGTDAGFLTTPMNNGTPGSATMNYFHTDARASVYAISNDSGAALEFDSFDPWGKRRVATGSNGTTSGADDPGNMITSGSAYGYIDEEQIASVTDLINLNARIYNRHTGRFISPDPKGLGGGRNVYAYTNNNPTSLADRSGLDCEDSFGDGTETLTCSLPQNGPPISLNQIINFLQQAGNSLRHNGFNFDSISVTVLQHVTARIITRTTYLINSAALQAAAGGNSPPPAAVATNGVDAAGNGAGNGDDTPYFDSYENCLLDGCSAPRTPAEAKLTAEVGVGGLGLVFGGEFAVGGALATGSSFELLGGGAAATTVAGNPTVDQEVEQGFEEIETELEELGAEGDQLLSRGGSGQLGTFFSEKNAAGGETFYSTGDIVQSQFTGIVNDALNNGRIVNILTGAHGGLGDLDPDAELLAEDVALFGGRPGVNIFDVTQLTREQVLDMVNGPNVTIGAFCNSALCLP
jgi:RHS repeat-associated protein